MTVICHQRRSAHPRSASLVLALATLLVLRNRSRRSRPAACERACANDYLTYCSQHDPDGPGVRQCMRANGLKRRRGCVSAL